MVVGVQKSSICVDFRFPMYKICTFVSLGLIFIHYLGLGVGQVRKIRLEWPKTQKIGENGLHSKLSLRTKQRGKSTKSWHHQQGIIMRVPLNHKFLKISYGFTSYEQKRDRCIRDQKHAKTTILASNFMLFGILSVHLSQKLVFQFIMSEKIWG